MALNDREKAVLDWIATKQEAMVALLEAIVNIDSGSYNKAGVDEVGRVIQAHLKDHGIPIEEFPDETFGNCYRATVGGEGGGGNRHILLMGHQDTVWPDGTVAERPFTIEGGRAYGPGVADMKGGLVINTIVLEAFKELGGAPAPLVGLYTADEEIASPSSRPVIEEHAKNAEAVFNSEPGRASGNLVVARSGASFFEFEVTGVAAHSGSRHADGVSAIEELSRKIQKLHALTDYEAGLTVNVGLISGGNSVNTVAPWAKAEVDVRCRDQAVMDAALPKVEAILAETHLEGTETRMTRERRFLPMSQSPESKTVFDGYRAAAEELGWEVSGERTGGSADSGFTAAVGAPTVCATGPVGSGGHSPSEYLELDSLIPRAQAMALSIMRLRA